MAWKGLKRTDFNFMEPLYLKINQLEDSYVAKKQEINSVLAIFCTICAYAKWWKTYQVNQLSWQYSPLRLTLLISFRGLFFFYYILSYDHWHLHLLTVDSGKPCKKRKFIPRSCRVIIWNTSWYHVVLSANVWLFGTSYQI